MCDLRALVAHLTGDDDAGVRVLGRVLGFLGLLAVDYLLESPLIRLFAALIMYFGLLVPIAYIFNFVDRLVGLNFDNPGPVGGLLIAAEGLIGFIGPLVAVILANAWIVRWLRGRAAPH